VHEQWLQLHHFKRLVLAAVHVLLLLLRLQINGMAKFPFLSLESSCVDFGSVVVGQTADASVRFGNHSAVPAHFSLAAAGGSGDGAFSIQPTQ
jgi:hypothetical protein